MTQSTITKDEGRWLNSLCPDGTKHNVKNGMCMKCGNAVRKGARRPKCFHVFEGTRLNRSCTKCGMAEPVGIPHQGRHRGRKMTEMQRQWHIAQLNKSQGNYCYFCNVPLLGEDTGGDGRFRARTLDHLQPLCRCGNNAPENLVLACYGCNSDKADMTESEYLQSSALAGRRAFVVKNFYV